MLPRTHLREVVVGVGDLHRGLPRCLIERPDYGDQFSQNRAVSLLKSNVCRERRIDRSTPDLKTGRGLWRRSWRGGLPVGDDGLFWRRGGLLNVFQFWEVFFFQKRNDEHRFALGLLHRIERFARRDDGDDAAALRRSNHPTSLHRAERLGRCDEVENRVTHSTRRLHGRIGHEHVSKTKAHRGFNLFLRRAMRRRGEQKTGDAQTPKRSQHTADIGWECGICKAEFGL